MTEVETDVTKLAQLELTRELIDLMYNKADNLSVGNVVKMRPGLQTKKLQGLMVVTDILEEPVTHQGDIGEVHYCDVNDTMVAFTHDGELLEFLVDSRRLMKVKVDEE